PPSACISGSSAEVSPPAGTRTRISPISSDQRCSYGSRFDTTRSRCPGNSSRKSDSSPAPAIAVPVIVSPRRPAEVRSRPQPQRTRPAPRLPQQDLFLRKREEPQPHPQQGPDPQSGKKVVSACGVVVSHGRWRDCVGSV